MLRSKDITRVHYGYVVQPDTMPEAGQPLLVSGFVVRHPQGTVLFDTGMSPTFETMRDYYQPHRRPVREALRDAGVDPAEISAIVNCHMHWDHAGGNYEFPGTPIYVQEVELAAAREVDFTLPEYTFDFPDVRLKPIDGEHELFPGIRIVSTPGHTPGHQSLLVEIDEGAVMLAGQASNTAAAFSAQALAESVGGSQGNAIGSYPDWVSSLHEWNVTKAFFAHDLLVWERDDRDLGLPAVD